MLLVSVLVMLVDGPAVALPAAGTVMTAGWIGCWLAMAVGLPCWRAAKGLFFSDCFFFLPGVRVVLNVCSRVLSAVCTKAYVFVKFSSSREGDRPQQCRTMQVV
jgi:hypothetical protein